MFATFFHITFPFHESFTQAILFHKRSDKQLHVEKQSSYPYLCPRMYMKNNIRHKL